MDIHVEMLNLLTIWLAISTIRLIYLTYFLAKQAITPIRTYLKKLARHTRQ